MTLPRSASSPETLVASVNGTSSPFLALTCEVNACTTCARMAHSHVLSPANGPLDAAVIFVAEAVGRRGGAVTGVPLTRDETGTRFQRFLDLARIARTDAFVTTDTVNLAAGGGERNAVRFGHPSGTLRVGAEARLVDGEWTVTKAIMSRSARVLMEGWVRVPGDSF